jgi:hemerythrin
MVLWDSKYETGVSSIDQQHQSLFNYINDLEECINDKYFEGPRIEIILNFFQMFCATHFSLEETCMMRAFCPVHDENKLAHEKFLAYYKKI